MENRDYMQFAVRIILAAGRRVGEGDIEVLPDLVALTAVVDEAVELAVAGLRECEFSYGEIGDRLSVSRQAVHARYGKAAAKRQGRRG